MKVLTFLRAAVLVSALVAASSVADAKKHKLCDVDPTHKPVTPAGKPSDAYTPPQVKPSPVQPTPAPQPAAAAAAAHAGLLSQAAAAAHAGPSAQAGAAQADAGPSAQA
ncbi:hypothetical protein PINS_up001440 [Pythium insidiosum]|nr:hypothetical protein PINS_up001440 [Pythium insidiosum]